MLYLTSLVLCAEPMSIINKFCFLLALFVSIHNNLVPFIIGCSVCPLQSTCIAECGYVLEDYQSSEPGDVSVSRGQYLEVLEPPPEHVIVTSLTSSSLVSSASSGVSSMISGASSSSLVVSPRDPADWAYVRFTVAGDGDATQHVTEEGFVPTSVLRLARHHITGELIFSSNRSSPNNQYSLLNTMNSLYVTFRAKRPRALRLADHERFPRMYTSRSITPCYPGRPQSL